MVCRPHTSRLLTKSQPEGKGLMAEMRLF